MTSPANGAPSPPPPLEPHLARLLRSIDQLPPDGVREAVWAQIETSRAGSRTTPRSLRLPLTALAAASLTALAVATFTFIRPSSEERPTGPGEVVATLTASGSSVAVVAPDGGLSTVWNHATPLVKGSTVRVGTKSRALVDNGRGTRIVLEPETTLQIDTGGEGHAATLARGVILVAVSPHTLRGPLSIEAGGDTVTVIGTLFAVATEASAGAAVCVYEGTVAVTTSKGTRTLSPGASVAGDGQVAPAVPAAAFVLLGLDTPEQVASPSAADGASHEQAAPDLGRPLPTDAAHQPPAPDRRPHEAQPVIREGSRAIDSTLNVAPSPSPSAAAAAAAAATDSVESRLLREATRERDPARAVALFDAVIAEHGSFEELASYSAARLLSKRDGRAAELRYREIMKKWPQGTFAAETTLGLIMVLMERADADAAEREIEAFLARAPDSERAPDIHFMQAEIARALRKDCKRAIDYYALAERTARLAEEALYRRASCLLAEGEEAAGRTALREYVARYPHGRFTEAARAALP